MDNQFDFSDEDRRYSDRCCRRAERVRGLTTRIREIDTVLRTGMPWRDLQHFMALRQPQWLDRSVSPRIWKRAFERLASQSRDSILMDGTVVKAHRAASRGKKARKFRRSASAVAVKTTKIHAVVDSKGRPLSFTVTGGQVHDSQVVEEILNTPRSPLAITADKAYDSERSTDGSTKVLADHLRAATPPSRKPLVQALLLASGAKTENFFCRVKECAGDLATRYDKLARNFLAPPRSSPCSTRSNSKFRQIRIQGGCDEVDWKSEFC